MKADLVIIGAGPAGMSAAITLRQAGLSVLVADENPAPGGQIHRAADNSPLAGLGLTGLPDPAGVALAQDFAASGTKHWPETTAFMIERDGADAFTVGLATAEAASLVETRHVLIATGALERPFPIPGWTLPGVMTAGAAQTLLKASAIVPEGRIVLAGTGPLLYLLAAQYAEAGVRLAAILDTTPPENRSRALPHLPAFLASRYAWKGLALLRKARAAHRVIAGVTLLEAVGAERLREVRAVADGRPITIAADTLLLHQGVVPQVNLAMAAGVPHRWNEARLAFEPEIGADGATAIPGLFIAGDSAGIGGAEAAQAQGEHVALAILDRIDPAGAAGRSPRHEASAARLKASLRGRAFLDALYRPADAFRMPADNVIICRCEEVTAGDIRRALAHGAQGPNQIKAFTRAGMGPCQGRSCALTVTELCAAALRQPPDRIGHMRIRAPVKPITVGQMAALASEPEPADDAIDKPAAARDAARLGATS